LAKSGDKNNVRKMQDVPQNMTENVHEAKLNDPKIRGDERKKNMSKQETGKKDARF